MAEASSQWNSLIRFKDPDGKIYYGEPDKELKHARVWTGDEIFELSRSDITVKVQEVRSVP